jgi:IS605 OrfB family transposase
MVTITYCKGLPTPTDEMNSLGFTNLEMFLTSFAPIFHKAVCDTVSHLLSESNFNKSSWNTHLQQSYGILKRHANGVISNALGLVTGATECRANHVKTLTGKLKSIEKWITKTEKKLKNAAKFYAKKNWRNSKTGCCFPLSCSLEFKSTNWRNLRFKLHNNKRRHYQLIKQIEHLKTALLQVKIPRHQVFIVGSKDETYGNQICQWDGNDLKFRVPSFLEPQFGKYVSSRIGNFDRNINRLPGIGAKTWHFYRKQERWCVAVQFTPSPVKPVSRSSSYGCIGIDMNPGSIGWAYCDKDGNLKRHGQIPLQMGLPKGKQDAQIVDACLQLATLATTFACPIVCEQLDFSTKKEALRERGRKYARMLSSWAYSRFYELLGSILSHRGIERRTINPAYTSVIGLVKFARMYGLASDEAAALAVARRGMRLSEKLPSAITAYLSVNDKKHVWHWWNKLNNLLKKSSISCRHDCYAISNWESQVNHLMVEASSSA